MNCGGFRSKSLSTETEDKIELLYLATHNPAITYIAWCVITFYSLSLKLVHPFKISFSKISLNLSDSSNNGLCADLLKV